MNNKLRIVKLFKKEDKIPILIFILLSLSIFFPFFKTGFIFAPDMIFTPKIYFPNNLDYLSLINCILWFLNLIIPSQILEKIIIFSVLFFSGFSMYKLIPVKSPWPKYFAGAFYLFNPFVYTRFLYGHLLFLLAYAIFPFIIKAIFDFLKNPNKKTTTKLIIWLAILIFTNIHFIYIAVLFFLISLIFYLYTKYKDKNYKKELLHYLSITFIFLLIINSFWFIPALSGKSKLSTSLDKITEKDFKAFKTSRDPQHSLTLNVLGLYGFWADNHGRYLSQKKIVPYWHIIILIIIILSFWGIISNIKYLVSKNKNTKYLILINLTTSIFAFFLAMGISFEPLEEFTLGLNKYFPFYKGFREPQKWSALLCLSFAYLSALGINDILRRLNKQKILQSLAISFFIALPFIYSPGLFWGFRGQLYSVDYPQDWYEINELINQDQTDFKILFLPWHQYMSFRFLNNQVIANPATKFFGTKTITNDNIKVFETNSSSKEEFHVYIQKLLDKKNLKKNFAKKLKNKLNIKYIILAKEYDWQNYNFLNNQKKIETIYDQKNLKVYKYKK